MKINIVKKLGNTQYTFEVEHEKDMEVLVMAGFIASMPEKCGSCGSEKVHLSSNKAKGYTFVKVICEECNARAQVGQYKDGGFFWKDWEKYEARKNTPSEPPPPDGQDGYKY